MYTPLLVSLSRITYMESLKANMTHNFGENQHKCGKKWVQNAPFAYVYIIQKNYRGRPSSASRRFNYHLPPDSWSSASATGVSFNKYYMYLYSLLSSDNFYELFLSMMIFDRKQTLKMQHHWEYIFHAGHCYPHDPHSSWACMIKNDKLC